MKTIRVAILGAECTGKTTLCLLLKNSISNQGIATTVVPEALRDFCHTHGRVPYAEEQISIMQEQAAFEANANTEANSHEPNLVLSDCAPITIAIYSELYFGDFGLYTQANAHHAKYDLSILLAPTIGWQCDGIFRESPEAQQRFHLRMKTWLEQNTHPWLEITENGEQRTAAAMSAIIPLLR
jgi:HTH-type transcriptional regulator, transcriptional repressor of NAD biosynthesis genes